MDTKRDSRGGNRKEAHTGRQMAFSVGFLVTSLLAVWLFQQLFVSTVLIQSREIPYSEFREKLKAGQLVEIHSEIQRIVNAQFERAQRLLTARRAALDSLTADLLRNETLDGSVVRQALDRSTAAA